MATVVNARDALLLAADSRTEIVSVPAPVETGPHVVINATSNIFYIAANGAISPEIIVLKAELRGGLQLKDFPLFTTIVGSATLRTLTLENQGNIGGHEWLLTRTLIPADMLSDFVTFRIIVYGTTGTYTADVSIQKVKEGAPGTRGSVTVFVSGQNSWSDTVANDAVFSATNTGYRVVGDQVTMHNNGGFAESKRWDGTAWILLSGVLSGSMLAQNSVPSSALANNSVDINKLATQVTSPNYVAGSSGFQLDKTAGQVNIYSGIVRGDVRASSAASGAIDTAALQANAVNTSYSVSSATNSHTATVSVSVPSGAVAMVIDIDPGLYVKTGVTYKAWANFTDNGVAVQAERFTVVGPSAGTHTIVVTRTNVDNDAALYTRPLHVGVTVIKK